MTTHRFVATEWHNVLGTLPPAFTVASGDTVITETLDASGHDKDGVRRRPGPNPMNGPIFIEGAAPGDALKVEIVRMTPNRATGWTRSSLAENVVDPGSVRELPSREAANWSIELLPRDERLAAQVQNVRISGQQGQVRGVELDFRNGDRAVTSIVPAKAAP